MGNVDVWTSRTCSLTRRHRSTEIRLSNGGSIGGIWASPLESLEALAPNWIPCSSITSRPIEFFTGMSRQACDVWEVDVSGLSIEEHEGWLIHRGPIGPERLQLAMADLPPQERRPARKRPS